MRVVPERSPWAQIVTVFGGLLIGPYAGLQISRALVPTSGLVETASIFAFALVFVGGTLLWMGIGVAVVVVSGLWRLLRGRAPGPHSLEATDTIVPPGYKAYVVLGTIAGGVVGFLAGLATDLPVGTAVAVWTSAGLAYGLLLSTAAHFGFLPFFEPE